MMSKRVLAMRFLIGVACASLVGCMEVKEDVREAVPKLVKGPEEAPFRTITGFTSALRCMDGLLIDYGVHDISMLVEDLKDRTKKVKVGAKDMLISAVSEMTRRSHAVRLIAFGADSGNLVSFLASANQTSPYSVVPDYDIRGSISQLDTGIAAKDVSAGLNITAGSASLGIGGAKTANASVLGLDLSVISTRDYSVVPGVVAKNSIVIFKEGSGIDADARISKLGVNYSMNFTRAEGSAQALRNLIELAVIELVGKLAKVPYWKCLGVDPKREEIQAEIYDWFYNLVADQEIVAYFQAQLTYRDFYDGPIDNQYNLPLTDAVIRYKKALGLKPVNGNIDLALFKALLNRPVPEPPAKEEAPGPQAPVERELAVKIHYLSGRTGALKPGESFALEVRPSQEAHLYCYYQNDKGEVMRFFPNRFERNSLVTPAKPLHLPGSMPFKLFASKSGKKERVACFASPKNVMKRLPAEARGTDFETLPVASLEKLEGLLHKALGDQFTSAYFEIKTR